MWLARAQEISLFAAFLCRHASRYRQASPRYLAAVVPSRIFYPRRLSLPVPSTPDDWRGPRHHQSSFPPALRRNDLTAHAPASVSSSLIHNTNLRRHGSHSRPVSLCHSERLWWRLLHGCTSSSPLTTAPAAVAVASPTARVTHPPVARRSVAASHLSAMATGWH